MKYKNLLFELQNNKIVAMPTSTVYGLVAKLDKNNISKLNKLKKRNLEQPLQMLISSLSEIEDKWNISEIERKYILDNIDDKTSFIVSAKKTFSDKFLTKSFNKTIMFRVVNKGEIFKLIRELGILFSTSANISGEKPLTNKFEIEKQFNIIVGDEKIGSGISSKIISVINNEIKEIR